MSAMLTRIWKFFRRHRVSLACAVINFLHLGIVRIVGLQVVASIQRYQVNRQQASFSYVMRFTVGQLSGPFIGYLGCKFRLEHIILSGCILSSVAIGACFFAESIVVITICWGVFLGVTAGMAFKLLPSFLPLHFKKNLATANGLSLAGGSLGGIVYLPFYEYFLNMYGISGSFLVLSAFTLNTLPAAMILLYSQRRLEWHQRKRNDKHSLIKNQTTHLATIPEVANDTRKASITNEVFVKEETNSQAISCKIEDEEVIDELSALHNNSNDVNSNMSSNLFGCDARTNISGRLEDTSIKEDISKSEIKEYCTCKSFITTEKDSNTCSRCTYEKNSSGLATVKCKIASDSMPNRQRNRIWKAFALFLDPLFFVIAFTGSCLMAIMNLHMAVIVDYAFDIGISMNHSVYLLLSSAIFDLVGLLSLGSVTDSGFISAEQFSALCYFCIGACAFGLAQSSEFFGMLVSLSVHSFFMGGQMLICPVIISKYFSGEKRIMAITCRSILYVPMSFAISPAIGYFRDDMGSYVWLFYFMTIFSVIGSILILLLPIIAKFGEKKRNNRIDG